MSIFLLILSVIIGAGLVLFLKPKKHQIRLLLAFSGSYLLAVTVLHLLPHVYANTSNFKQVGLLILIGILVQSILESFSKGAEHGHIHIHTNGTQFPWLLFVSLCLHAFSEGIPIHHSNDHLLWAIVVHKIPITIVLTSFLLHSKLSKKNTFLFLMVFSLMSPLGILLNRILPTLQNYEIEINAFIIGIFLHISTIILFESTENHKFNFQKFTAIILGILLTVLSF